MNTDDDSPLPARRRRSTLKFIPFIDLMFIVLMIFLLIVQAG